MTAPSSIFSGSNVFSAGEFKSSNISDVLSYAWNGGGSAVSTTNTNIYIYVPVALRILGWALFCDASATLTIDIWQALLASAPPTVSNTICNGNYPSITAGTQNSLIDATAATLGFASSLNVNGIPTIPAGSAVILNVASNNNAKYIGFNLLCRSGS